MLLAAMLLQVQLQVLVMAQVQPLSSDSCYFDEEPAQLICPRPLQLRWSAQRRAWLARFFAQMSW